jgi:non-specific serine/threonine protein kinase/serine/threonine-protein kinase
MEYIEGSRIDAYCDARPLHTRERLQLFRRVCDAVQYAHQHLVVHRDLKPANILITADGVPKLLDFGIAKLLDPELFLQTAEITASMMKPMTPEFASPEQARGEPITTASDVYSLGVLLYRLLTGHSPYQVAGRPAHAIARAISEQEPVKPSQVINQIAEETGFDGQVVKLTPELVSGPREGHPHALRQRLAGDLDTIVLKALRKEPERRYASVEQFSEDIRRHLEGLPVLARKDTLGYRTVKFVRRNKTGVLATGLVALTLLGAIVATAWQAHIARQERARAERRFNDVRRLANSIIFDVHDAIQDLPGSTPARRVLVNNALHYLDSLAKEAKGDLSLQSEMAAAYQRLGDVQGNPYRGNLGDTAGAALSYAKAAAIREAIVAADPDNKDALFDLAESYRVMGNLQVAMGRISPAMEYARKAVAMSESLAKAHPSDARILDELESAYELVGDIQGGNGLSGNLGDVAGALENHRKALAIAERVAAAHPDDAHSQRAVAIYNIKVGDDLAKTGNRAAALQNYQKTINIYQALVSKSQGVQHVRELAITHGRVAGVLLMDGNPRAAVEHFTKWVRPSQKLAAADPQNRLARIDLAEARASLGKAMAEAGRIKDGLALLSASAAVLEKERSLDPRQSEIGRSLALNYVWRGQTRAQTGNFKEALKDCRKALALFQTLSAAEPNDVDGRIAVAATHAEIAALLLTQGNATAAVGPYTEALALLEPPVASQSRHEEGLYAVANVYSGLGVALASQAATEKTASAQLERWSKARSWLQKSVTAWRRVNNPGTMTPNGFSVHNRGMAEQLASAESALARLQAAAN